MADNQNIDIQHDSEKVSETMIMAVASSDGAAIGAATGQNPATATGFAAVGGKIVQDMGGSGTGTQGTGTQDDDDATPGKASTKK